MTNTTEEKKEVKTNKCFHATNAKVFIKGLGRAIKEGVVSTAYSIKTLPDVMDMHYQAFMYKNDDSYYERRDAHAAEVANEKKKRELDKELRKAEKEAKKNQKTEEVVTENATEETVDTEKKITKPFKNLVKDDPEPLDKHETEASTIDPEKKVEEFKKARKTTKKDKKVADPIPAT